LKETIMGLLDSLVGAATQALGGANAPQGGPDWVGLIAGLVSHGSAQGGLAGVLQQLEAGGLGDQVRSWVGTGANMPVSGEQLGSAIGGDILGKLGAQAGVSSDEVSAQLSHWLPKIVDQLTPNGQLPDAGSLTGMLSSVLKG
jgi:uncharacterized protein YidB (DUF937 family)